MIYGDPWYGNDPLPLRGGPAEAPKKSFWDMIAQTWPGRIAQSAYESVRLPGDVYSGVTPMAPPGLRREDFTDAPGWEQPNDSIIGRATDLAGTTMVGASPFSSGKNSLRQGFTVDYFNTPIRVHENPSAKELAGIINRTKYKAVRAIDAPDNTRYVWDAAEPALHEQMAKVIGIPFDRSRSFMLGID